jgi:hypothetical protein
MTVKDFQRKRALARAEGYTAESNLHRLLQAEMQSGDKRYTYHPSISDEELLPVYYFWYEVIEMVHPDQKESETQD